MGFEAISVGLELDSAYAETLSLLSSLGFAVAPSQDRDTVRLEYINEQFIVEAAISHGTKGGVELRIEQALCNPPAADAFLVFVVDKLLSLGPFRLWFMTSLRPGIKFDSVASSKNEVAAVLYEQVSGLRSKWQSAFGNKTGAVRVAQAYSFIGLI